LFALFWHSREKEEVLEERDQPGRREKRLVASFEVKFAAQQV